jgi:nucleotide-binding universal stress UspA family protein
LATALKIPVDLLNVFDSVPPQFADPEHGLFETQLTSNYRDNAVDYLEKTASSLKSSGVTISCEAHESNPADQIINQAETDSNTLIAMVTHGRSGLGRWVLGSVTDKVLHGASNPLLITHAQEEGQAPTEATLENLVVPLDGSALADKVLPHVTALSSAMGLNVILVRVTASADEYYFYVDISSAAGINTDRFYAYAQESEVPAARYLSQVKENLLKNGVKSVKERVVSGNSAISILDLVQETPNCLVALTTHGRSGVERWILGSVTDRLVRHSGQPVLVIRADD